MPYISQGRRRELDPFIAKLVIELWAADPLVNPGVINYTITKIILGCLKGSTTYSAFNTILGVLECVKQELYRRVVVPYEDHKRQINGDVF